MSDMRFDVAFYTHATAATGFGHAARCGRLAAMMAEDRPEARIAVIGDFSDSARRAFDRMQLAPLAESEAADWSARLGVYDRMDDTEDPSVVDWDRFAAFRQHVDGAVFMANAMIDPFAEREADQHVGVIGYKLGGPRSLPPRRYWGLEFAPVMMDEPGRVIDEPGRVFLAMGGAPDGANLEKAVRALGRVSWVESVAVLISPVQAAMPAREWLRPDQRLETVVNAPSLAPELERAGLVVASYGHLGYEALALGRPCCLLGQKRFQADFAERLAEEGLCVSLGRIGEMSVDELADGFAAVRSERVELGRRAARRVSRRGLAAIADLLSERLT